MKDGTACAAWRANNWSSDGARHGERFKSTLRTIDCAELLLFAPPLLEVAMDTPDAVLARLREAMRGS